MSGTHTETTDRLAARAVRNADADRTAYAEGLVTAWEMVTGLEDDSDVYEHLHAAAARHNDRQNRPVFVKDSAGNHIGAGDEVRIGQGYALWTIDSVDSDGETLHMTDALTNRRRHINHGKVTLSIEGTDAYAARAEQGLFNIF